MKYAIALSAFAAVMTLSGCQSTANQQDLRSLPDSYFENRALLSTEERREVTRRRMAKLQEIDRRAACRSGSRPAIDRSKLNCENVEGSPEYKALHGEEGK